MSRGVTRLKPWPLAARGRLVDSAGGHTRSHSDFANPITTNADCARQLSDAGILRNPLRREAPRAWLAE